MEQSLRCNDQWWLASSSSMWKIVVVIIGITAAFLPEFAAGQPSLLLSANREPVSKCTIDCSNEPSKHVCGTDSRTYRNRCELQRAKCEGHFVQVYRRGKCQGVRRGKNPGKPRPNQKCKSRDNNLFFTELLSIFVGEYNRSLMFSNAGIGTTASTTTTDPILDTFEKKAADWKFLQLDTNRNKVLDRKEVKNFRRMMKKIKNLRACAKRFSALCDRDNNRRITHNEWIMCLGANTEATIYNVTPATSDGENGRTSNSRKDPMLPTNKVYSSRPHLVPEDPMDCFTERQNALNELQASQQASMSVFVPECESDGRYAQVQCFPNASYCFCVDQIQGTQINLSAMLNPTPDCEKLMKVDVSIKERNTNNNSKTKPTRGKNPLNQYLNGD